MYFLFLFFLQLFEGHFIPSITFNQQSLSTVFDVSRVFEQENRYNYTFKFIDIDRTNSTGKLSFSLYYDYR